MSGLEKFCHFIGVVNDWIGNRIASFFLIPLTLIVSLEVVLRYVFNKPQIWTWDINMMLYGTLIMLGAGYVFLQGRHVRVDILVGRLSPRKNAIQESVINLFVLLTIGILLWQLLDAAWESVLLREGMGTNWNPPYYPLKVMIAFGALLLLLQVVVKFIRDLTLVIHPKGGD